MSHTASSGQDTHEPEPLSERSPSSCTSSGPEDSTYDSEALDAHRTYLLKVAADLLRPELRPKVSPSDLVQESVVIAMRKFGSFRGTQRQLRSWLETILRNEYCNVQRHFYKSARHAIRREISIDAVDAQGRAPEIADHRDEALKNEATRSRQLELIRAEVERLTAAERDVFVLKMELGIPMKEIAGRLGISEATAYKRYKRAIDRLYERCHDTIAGGSET